MKIAVFYVRNCSFRELVLTDYYYQDVLALRALGYKVVPVFRNCDIPLNYDLLFIWWWSYALYPVFHSYLLRKPSVITGTMNISGSCYLMPGSKINNVTFLNRSLFKACIIWLSAKFSSLNLFVNNDEKLLASKFLNLTSSAFLPHCISPKSPTYLDAFTLLFPGFALGLFFFL